MASAAKSLTGDNGVDLKPDENADGTGAIEVYGPFTNKATADTEFQFDSNGDDLWDVELSDDGTNSGLVLRNGLPFIQFGVGAKLKVKQCGGSLDAGFFYDEDDDGTYDAADDFCWGLGGYDADCDCVADTGGGTGDMTKAAYDTDNDSTVDLAEALATPVTQVDIDGDGTREISLSAAALYADPDEDGTPSYKLTSTALNFDTNEDGTYAGQIGEAGGYSSASFSFGSDVNVMFTADNNEDGTGGIQLNVEGKNGLVWNGLLTDCDGDGSALGWDATTGFLTCGDDDGTGDVTDVFGCASGDCNDISVADTEQLDFSAVNNSATTEGLVLPQGTSVLTGTATGQIGFDTTDGRGAVYAGGLNNGLAMAVPVNVQSPEYVYAFSDMFVATAVGMLPYYLIEGSTSIPALDDANPETSSSAIGVLGPTTGTTAGNEATLGLARSTDTRNQQFEPRKMRLFGARGATLAALDSRTRKLAVGGVRTSTDGNWNTKTDGIFFWCDPASDLDNDGTVGDSDTDGTGTATPDGDCGDAGEDADDCKWYAVTMNNATDGSQERSAPQPTLRRPRQP